MVFLLAIAQNQRFWVDLRNFLFKVSPIFELSASVTDRTTKDNRLNIE